MALWSLRGLQLSRFTAASLVPTWPLLFDWLTLYPLVLLGFLLALPAEYVARQLWVERMRLVSEKRELHQQMGYMESVRREELVRRAQSKAGGHSSHVHKRAGLKTKAEASSAPQGATMLTPVKEASDRHS